MWLTLTPHESTSSWLGAAGRSVGAVMRIRCSVEGRQRTAAPLATARRSPRWQSSHPRSPRQRQAKGVQEEGAGALKSVVIYLPNPAHLKGHKTFSLQHKLVMLSRTRRMKDLFFLCADDYDFVGFLRQLQVPEVRAVHTLRVR
jgi:hypothetical protein